MIEPVQPVDDNNGAKSMISNSTQNNDDNYDGSSFSTTAPTDLQDTPPDGMAVPDSYPFRSMCGVAYDAP